MRRPGREAAPVLLAGLLVLGAGGCRMDMQDQPRYEPDSASAFFTDGRADRPAVEGAIPHRAVRADAPVRTGQNQEGQPVAQVPVPIDAALLERGRQRYDIYCAPCHGRVGDGEGMIVQRGFKRPVSFHDERLRQAPAGYFFDAISRGFGVMPSYAAQVPVVDRWAVVAYVRTLQLSQHFPAADLSPDERARLDFAAQQGGAAAARPHAGEHE